MKLGDIICHNNQLLKFISKNNNDLDFESLSLNKEEYTFSVDEVRNSPIVNIGSKFTVIDGGKDSIEHCNNLTFESKCFRSGNYLVFESPNNKGWSLISQKDLLLGADKLSPTKKYFYIHVENVKFLDPKYPDFNNTSLLKEDLQDALWRVGATQTSKALKQALLLVAKKQNITHVAYKALIQFLDSDFGEAFIAFAAGHALTKIDHEQAQKFAKELRVHGIATGGNALIGELVSYMLPEFSTIIQSLPSQEMEQESGSEELEEEELIKEKYHV